MAPKLVQDDVGRGIPLEIDDDPNALAVRFIANVRNAFDPLVLGGLGDLLDQSGLADLVGDCGKDDRATLAAAFLDLVAGAHDDRAAPALVGGPDPGLAEDQGPGREIGARDDLHQLFDGDRRVVHIGFAGGDDFAEIVRRDVRRHAHRDPAGAVDEQVGKTGRKHLRLASRGVVIGDEVDRVLVEIFEKGHRHLGETSLGVAHRRRRIGVHRPEIALAVDQRHPHRPILGHSRERVVDRGVAVRMVIAHHVAHDLCRFAIGPAGDEAAFLAGVEDSPVHRLQAVADVRKGARDDHRHGIVEIGGLHLVDDGDGGDIAGFDGRRCAGQWKFLIVSA